MQQLKRALALLLLITVAAAGCGDGDEPASTASGNATDAQFVNGMIPHREVAIEMAELAERRSDRKQIKELAAAILESQQREIAQMSALQAKLPLNAGTMMTVDAAAAMARELEALAIAPDFDREFILDMIPHHEAAITMARRLQADGANDDLRKLSRAIIGMQYAEIASMREWYQAWYGKPVPTSPNGGHGGH